MNILIVDDDRSIINFLDKWLLVKWPDLKISTACNGKDGVQVSLGFRPCGASPLGLIISDWQMPKMNGVSMVRKIRRRNQDTPIIMLSSDPTGLKKVLKEKGLTDSVQAVIGKPMTNIHTFLNHVETVLFMWDHANMPKKWGE